MDYNTSSGYDSNSSSYSSSSEAPSKMGGYCCNKGCGANCVLKRTL